MKLVSLIICSLLPLSAQATNLVATTSIEEKDCVTIASDSLDEEPEVDYYQGECQGLGGYRVYVEGGDLRYNINLGYGNTKIDLIAPPSFHSPVGSKVYWTYERNDEGVSYNAFVYTMSYQSYDTVDEIPVDREVAYIVRLDKESSCVVDVVIDETPLLEKALTKAQNVKGKPCIKQTGVN